MFNIQIDENNFYTGNYASVGSLPNGINVEKLPPSENSLCYKLVDKEITKEVSEPILQYTKITESDTEFETLYTITSLDEDGNTVEMSITEEEYEALDDSDKESVNVSQIAKIITITLTKSEFDALNESDKTNFVASYKEDENGNIVYETVQTTEVIKDWEFSQEKYDELLSEKISKQIENEKLTKSLSAEQQRADIDYIALMTGIDLEV